MVAASGKDILRDARATLRRLRDWAALRGLAQRADGSLVGASVWRTGLVADDTMFTTAQFPAASAGAVDRDLAPILGEYAWHSLTVDPRVAQVSEEHYAVVATLLDGGGARAMVEPRVLEVAAYAHTTGYMLHERLGARTDLLDISPSTLRLGRRLAREQGLRTDGTICVAGDFHDLPYDDDQFDVVYICSALHHTWRWQRVLSEMVRVLAPGGILLLENEPCRRLFCHYRFRANRPESFGELEQALDRLGILRTVAEPFPSTRPETLFGMVENQTIPIAALCAELAATVAVTVSPEVCMGPLERELVARTRDGTDACTRWLTEEMKYRVEQARPALSAADAGMGFNLPSPDEIGTLCAATVKALIDLPADRSSPDFRLGLADVFGASVRMSVRKKGVRRAPPAARLRQDYPSREEVVCAFPPDIARLLDPRGALLPDIQSAPAELLRDVFPAAEWRLDVTADGLRNLLPATACPCLDIPVPRPGPLLLLVRLYVAYEGKPYRIALCDDNGELARFDAFRADSLLLSPVIHRVAGTSRLRLSIRTRGLGAAATDEPAGLFTVSYAGAFSL